MTRNDLCRLVILTLCAHLCLNIATAQISFPGQVRTQTQQSEQPPQPVVTLDIYFIDTEGGAATLIVTPLGESVLVDSGNPGERDAQRIARAARDGAKLKEINHYITTHWHSDHVGGIGRLAKLIPVKNYYDQGIPSEPLPRDVNAELIAAYRAASEGKAVLLRAGSEIKLKTKKSLPPIRLRVLAADGLVEGEAGGSPQIKPCGENFKSQPEDTSDNANSIALLLSFGRFDFFDGGDLTWNVEHKLVCPKNLPGAVDVFQVNHHGLDASNNPALVRALNPRVSIINNGARKGGQARTFATLREVQDDPEAIFQLHQNVQTTERDNTSPDFIANDEENCRGEYIKLSVDSEAKNYTVSIPGKGTTKAFRTR